jgi:hypothetical protein
VGRAGVHGVSGLLQRWMTAAQLDASAHAPCSSTIVGFGPGCPWCAVPVWADATWLAEMSSVAMVIAAAVTMTRSLIRSGAGELHWSFFLKSVPRTDTELAALGE